VQDLLIIPTYDRPEMLWLCLEHLAVCPDIQSVQIRVYVDAHVNQHPPPRAEIEAVIEKFPLLSLQIGFRPPHQYHGNSYNVLMAYRDAYETDAKYVFMVEDDVMVHPRFFEWHRAQHAHHPLGCSIAVVKEPQHGNYASLGVCFRREKLQVILPHCRPAYFQNLRAYCRSQFPPGPWDCEQDGLFCRLLKGQPVVWANTPYAQHVGWYGYHRKRSVRPTGTLNERHLQVKQILSNSELLRGCVRDFGDIKPLQLSAASGTLTSQPSRLSGS